MPIIRTRASMLFAYIFHSNSENSATGGGEPEGFCFGKLICSKLIQVCQKGILALC